MTISDSKLKKIVCAVTLFLPIAITILAIIPGLEMTDEMKEAMFVLPKLNASINGTAFVVLIAALIAIKNKNVALHKKLTTTAMILSVMFLLSYIAFHFTTESTHYCGEGSLKYVYFFILITHIILSGIIVPLVLFTYARGHMMQVEKHKKIAKITLPLWLYVTATGVIVYLMISPCYL